MHRGDNSADGRQSQLAAGIQRGVARLLTAHGLAVLTEFPLANGLRADVVGLSGQGDIWIIEIKSSLADFRSDAKWSGYLGFCDEFYFAVAPDFPRDALPGEPGLILADKYAGEIARRAPIHKVASARRRAMILRFARTAAWRLLLGQDPHFASENAPDV